MDANIYDGIKESTATTGNGLTVTLTQELGFGRFADVAAVGEDVYYVIRNGSNFEIGTGAAQAGNTLDRTTPLVTLVGGVYDNTAPVRITLAGNSTVSIAPTAKALLDVLNDSASITIANNGFTPEVYGTTAAGSPGYNNQLGHYTKIGDVYHVWFYVKLTSLGGMTGDIEIKNFPLCGNIDAGMSSAGVPASISGLNLATAAAITLKISNGGTVLKLKVADSTTGVSSLLDTEITDIFGIGGYISYKAG